MSSRMMPLPNLTLAEWLEECHEVLVAMLTAKGYLEARHAKVHVTHRALPQGMTNNRVFIADESSRIGFFVSGSYLVRYIRATVRLSAAKGQQLANGNYFVLSRRRNSKNTDRCWFISWWPISIITCIFACREYVALLDQWHRLERTGSSLWEGTKMIPSP